MLLEHKELCTLSDILDFIISLLKEGEEMTRIFQTHDMKEILKFHYGESITIASNSWANESDSVFSSSISAAELAVKLNHIDKIKEAAIQLRKVLMDVNFGLQTVSFFESIMGEYSGANSFFNILCHPLQNSQAQAVSI